MPEERRLTKREKLAMLPDTRTLLEHFDAGNKDVEFALLTQRFAVLTIEKEDIEERLQVLEDFYQRGIGVIMALSVLGAMLGVIVGLWKLLWSAKG